MWASCPERWLNQILFYKGYAEEYTGVWVDPSGTFSILIYNNQIDKLDKN